MEFSKRGSVTATKFLEAFYLFKKATKMIGDINFNIGEFTNNLSKAYQIEQLACVEIDEKTHNKIINGYIMLKFLILIWMK